MSYWNDISDLPTDGHDGQEFPVRFGTGRIKRSATIKMYVDRHPDEDEQLSAHKLTKTIGKYVSPGEVRGYWPHARKLDGQRFLAYRCYLAECPDFHRALTMMDWLPLWEQFCQHQAQLTEQVTQTEQRLEALGSAAEQAERRIAAVISRL